MLGAWGSCTTVRTPGWVQRPPEDTFLRARRLRIRRKPSQDRWRWWSPWSVVRSQEGGPAAGNDFFLARLGRDVRRISIVVEGPRFRSPLASAPRCLTTLPPVNGPVDISPAGRYRPIPSVTSVPRLRHGPPGQSPSLPETLHPGLHPGAHRGGSGPGAEGAVGVFRRPGDHIPWPKGAPRGWRAPFRAYRFAMDLQRRVGPPLGAGGLVPVFPLLPPPAGGWGRLGLCRAGASGWGGKPGGDVPFPPPSPPLPGLLSMAAWELPGGNLPPLHGSSLDDLARSPGRERVTWLSRGETGRRVRGGSNARCGRHGEQRAPGAHPSGF